ncbi:MAG: hypothetical protein ABR915_13520 [Thermoguttaceae bacterium]
MNEDLAELQRRLEQATARGEADQDTLHAETAALREAWLALGQLLEAAGPEEEEGDSPHLPERRGGGPRIAGVAQMGTVPFFPASPPARRWARRLVRLVVTIAATVLIAVASVIGWSVAKRGPGQGHTPDASLAEHRPPAVPSVPGTKQPVGGVSQIDLAWSDPIDNAIARAGQAVAGVEADWRTRDDASTAIQYGLRQVEEDMRKNPL